MNIKIVAQLLNDFFIFFIFKKLHLQKMCPFFEDSA